MTPVATDMESDIRIEIRYRLEPGREIGASPPFLLDSESGLDAGFTRMENTGTGEALP